MLKKEARKLYIEKRRQITPQQKIKWDDLLLIQFQFLQLPFLSTVLSFYPMEERKEPNTFLITDYLSFKNPGLQIAYPKTDVVHHTMQAVLCTDETVFQPNPFYIPEPVADTVIPPEAIDAVLVPLLVCDKRGYRVGYGKGFYDRFLSQCRTDCLKIGLSYYEPIEQLQDAGHFDIPLNICITLQQVYVF